MSSPATVSMRFCRAAVLFAAISGFVGMAAFSPLSCYCRVAGMFPRRDRAARVILQTSVDTECSMYKENSYTEQLV
jgi:hypothetical protein